MKHNNIHIIEVPEGEETEQRIENLFVEIMTKNFPNLVKEKTHKSRKYRQSRTKWTRTGPRQETSYLK